MEIRRDQGAAFVRTRREAMGLTVTELARACGITPGHLCNIEAGRRRLTDELARTIAYHLGIPLESLGDDPSAWGMAA